MLDSETEQIETLRQQLSERAEIIVDLQRRLTLVRAAAQERGALVDTLHHEAERIRTSYAELEARHDTLVRENGRINERMLDLERTVRARQNEIEGLNRVCEERLAEIERISLEAERRSSLLADMTAAFEAALRRLEHIGAGGSPPAPRTGGP